MDFGFINQYYNFYLVGIKNTILLSILAVLFGVFLGIILSLMKLSSKRILRFISSAYIEFIKGTPLLVQLYIIYYGLPYIGIEFPDIAAFKSLVGISFNDFMAGVITMGINSGAYVGEIFRAGIQAIDTGQMEAARSLGMPQSLAMRYIILPQAVRNILPALGNELVVVIKESSIVSVIGIAELMYNADTVRGNSFQPFEPLLVAALLYFMVTFPLSKLLGRIERRMRASA